MHYANFGELDAPLGSWVGGVEILIEMQVGTWESVNNGVGDDLIAPSPDDRVQIPLQKKQKVTVCIGVRHCVAKMTSFVIVSDGDYANRAGGSTEYTQPIRLIVDHRLFIADWFDVIEKYCFNL